MWLPLIEKPLPNTLRFGGLEILLGNTEKPHEGEQGV